MIRRPAFLQRRWSGFAPVRALDRDAFAEGMARTLPDLQYVMFFTPRSGSSSVADILNQTRRMGHVREAFNPEFMGAMTRSFNAASLDEYCAVLPRRLQSGGVFGFQITILQKDAVFGSDKAFLNRFSTLPWVWQVRSDIVLQAVSLYKMDVAQISHAKGGVATGVGRAEHSIVYDAARIRYWLEHILRIERQSEALFKRAGIEPLRLNYERNSAMKPNHLANVVGRHVGRERMRMVPIESGHRKIGSDQNVVFAERFRTAHTALLDRIDDTRAQMIEKSVYYGPKGSF